MAKRKGFRIPGLSFSWKRASGLTAARQKFARATGVPTTRQGMKRKLGFYGLGLIGSLLSRNRQPATPDANVAASGCGCISGMLSLSLLALMCGGVVMIWSLALDLVPVELKKPRQKAAQTHVAASPTPSRPTLIPEAEATPALPVGNPKKRTWTSTAGTSLDAEFVSMANGEVKLRKEDGSVLPVPLDKLSESDRQWVKDYRRGK
jgi:hypothetical protein